MSILKLGLCSALNQEVLDKLRSKNITRITEFICKDPESIVDLTGIPYKDVVSIKNVILAKYSSISVNGRDFYNSIVDSTTILSTGVKSLDKITDGGLYSGEVTEIAGDVASGKTQICLSTCGSTVSKSNQTVIYIDTGAAFSARRVQQLISDSSVSKDEVLSRIQVYDAPTFHDVFSVLENILCECKKRTDEFFTQLKLIVVDNVASVIYPFLGGGTFSESQGLISLLGQKLKGLAAELSVAVLTTNNLVKGEHNKKTSSLGRVWSHIPHVRLNIEDSEQYHTSARKIIITKHSRGKTGGSCTINFKENGPIT